jgi:hypothetical protein
MGVHASGGDMTARSNVSQTAERALNGWVVFSGTMLAVVGALNVIYGIAAIDDSSFFVNNANFVISGLNTWGWVTLIIGAVQVLCAFGVWARNTPATWAGIGFAGLNAIAQLLMLPAYPFLSIALFGVDMLVIYGLAVHGGRNAAEY